MQYEFVSMDIAYFFPLSLFPFLFNFQVLENYIQDKNWFVLLQFLLKEKQCKPFYNNIAFCPTLYISLIAEHRNMKISLPGQQESQLFYQQVWIELSAVRTCSVAPCIIISIKSSMLIHLMLCSFHSANVTFE